MSYVSLLLPVGDLPPDALSSLLDSLRTQPHQQWELHALLGGAPSCTVSALADLARHEPRLRVHPLGPGPVAAALQAGLDAAHGDLLMVIDGDDVPHEHALAALTATFREQPEVDVVYCDEEWVTDDDGVQAFHKPDWSPHYLLGCAYLGRLTAYRTSLVRAVGGFRDGTEPAHEWDLALRATTHARGIAHRRQVLSHGARPPWWLDPSAEARAAAAEVLAAHLSDPQAEVEAGPGEPAWFRVRRPFAVWPRVSVVIPTAGARGADGMLVDACLSGLLDRTDHGELEVCVVVSGNAPSSVDASLAASYGDTVTVLRMPEPFNYSASINAGVRATTGSVVLALNDDTEVLAGDWLRRMVEHVLRPEIGVVGAKLLYPDGTVQHAGVCSNMGGMPYHPSSGHLDGTGYLGDLVLDLDHLAVTGACQAVRRAVFDRVGGYDTALPLNYNDIDFCLKVRTLGLSVLQVNGAVLRHHESATRPPSVSPDEEKLYADRWYDEVMPDPYERSRPGPR